MCLTVTKYLTVKPCKDIGADTQRVWHFDAADGYLRLDAFPMLCVAADGAADLVADAAYGAVPLKNHLKLRMKGCGIVHGHQAESIDAGDHLGGTNGDQSRSNSVLRTVVQNSNESRRKCWPLGHLLVRSLVPSHRSFIGLLCTARFAHALRSAKSLAPLHSFADSLIDSLPSS